MISRNVERNIYIFLVVSYKWEMSYDSVLILGNPIRFDWLTGTSNTYIIGIFFIIDIITLMYLMCN